MPYKMSYKVCINIQLALIKKKILKTIKKIKNYYALFISGVGIGGELIHVVIGWSML